MREHIYVKYTVDEQNPIANKTAKAQRIIGLPRVLLSRNFIIFHC